MTAPLTEVSVVETALTDEDFPARIAAAIKDLMALDPTTIRGLIISAAIGNADSTRLEARMSFVGDDQILIASFGGIHQALSQLVERHDKPDNTVMH